MDPSKKVQITTCFDIIFDIMLPKCTVNLVLAVVVGSRQSKFLLWFSTIGKNESLSEK